MTTDAIRPTDGRDEFQRMSRREIWRALSNAGINFPTGCTSEDGIKLLQANAINPMEVIEFEQVPVQQENGQIQYQNHPKRKTPNYSEAELMRREEEMSKRLEEAAEKEKASNKKSDALESKVDQLANQVAALTQALLKQTEKKPKETDPQKMKYMAFKKWCKDRGHELQKGEDREAIIAKLEAKDEDPS